MRVFKKRHKGDGHEYRIAYGLFAILGHILGLIDGMELIAWDVKAFLFLVDTVILFLWITYEFVSMGRPKNLGLSSIILYAGGISGIIGVWHFTWLFVITLMGRPIPPDLWLAPNIYINSTLYTIITGILLAVYISLGLLINFSNRFKEVYQPTKI